MGGCPLRTTIQCSHLRPVQVFYVFAHVGKLRIVCCGRGSIQAAVRQHLTIMSNYHITVGRNLSIQLERADTQLKRIGKSLQCAFGHQPQTAAVGLQVKIRGVGRLGDDQSAGC